MYVRDGAISNISITEATILEIYNYLTKSETELNKKFNIGNGYCWVSFVMRFDNKGYVFYEFSDFIKEYKRAKSIERIVIRLQSNGKEQLNSTDDAVEIWLSNAVNENSYLKVESDSQDWVNAVFLNLDEMLEECESRVKWIRSKLVLLLIQLIGFSSFFIFSLVISNKFHTLLDLENSFIIAFIFFFLVFSNIWTYVNPLIVDGIQNKLFPNISFIRSNVITLESIVHSQLTKLIFKLIGWLLFLGFTYSLSPSILMLIDSTN